MSDWQKNTIDKALHYGFINEKQKGEAEKVIIKYIDDFELLKKETEAGTVGYQLALASQI